MDIESLKLIRIAMSMEFFGQVVGVLLAIAGVMMVAFGVFNKLFNHFKSRDVETRNENVMENREIHPLMH